MKMHILVAAWLVAGVAIAQPTRTSDYLRLFDANHDGRVQLAEYQDWLSYGFDRMDTNRDGRLVPSEQPGARGSEVTRDAYRARLADQFRKLDANHDGTLNARELASPPR